MTDRQLRRPQLLKKGADRDRAVASGVQLAGPYSALQRRRIQFLGLLAVL
jgi:hypothetical protein